jgi:selenide,water dikinase
MDSSVIPSERYPEFSVVSTTDFFYPLVESPYEQGRVACANVLSDLYAMGVEFVDNVLMILAASLDMEEKDRDIVTREMIRGFDDQCKAAGTQVSGGQTVMNPWPIIGGVAKSICKKTDIIMPTGAVEGDVLVLTKPLGTQVAVNVKQWMKEDSDMWKKYKEYVDASTALRAFVKAQESMARLNKNGAKMMQKHGAHCATDVTGFGLLGHAQNLASNQLAPVSFTIHTLPILRGMKGVADHFPFQLLEGLSAETSGGLLVALPKDVAEAFCKEIEELDGEPAWIVGEVVKGERTAEISKTPKVLEV